MLGWPVLHMTLMNDPRAGKIVGTTDYLSPEQIQTPLEIKTCFGYLLARMHTLLRSLWQKCPFLVAIRHPSCVDISKRHRGIRASLLQIITEDFV